MSNMTCLVCETGCRGHHLGAQCCRACASFYRRTNQLQLKYKCKSNRNCDVSHKNRYSCRHCRYQKCVSIGMSDGSNVTKDLPSLKETPTRELSIQKANGVKTGTQSTMKIDLEVSMQSPPDAYNTKNLELKALLDSLFAQRSIINSLLIPLTLCQQALLAFSKHRASWPKISQEKINSASNVLNIETLVEAYRVEIGKIATFCMSIEAFAELPADQKWAIFRNFWPSFIEMSRVYWSCGLLGYDPDDNRTVHFDGSIVGVNCKVRNMDVVSELDVNQIKNLMKGSQVVFRDWFTIPFKSTAPDEYEFMFLALSMMWNVKTLAKVSANTLFVAETAAQRLSEDLYNYYAFQLKKPNFAERIYKLSHLVTAMDRFQDRRKEDNHMSRTFNMFKQDKSTDCFK